MNTYKQRTISRKLYVLLSIGIGLCLLNACTKEAVLPGDAQSINLNFYAATDVMGTAYGSGNNRVVAIYLDKLLQQSGPIPAGTGNGFPTFEFGYVTTNGGPPQHPDTKSNGSINYVSFSGSSHRVYFTDINNTAVIDTVIDFTANGSHTLYLADAPLANGAAAAYRLLVATEPREVPAGKTGVRFINLSPDAGTLTLNRMKDVQGNATAYLGELAYGRASDYFYFDGTDQVSGLLRFVLNNTAAVSLGTGTPLAAGRSYVVVVQGLVNPQQRKVATGKNADGSIKTATITIGSNLRADIRRSY